MTVVIENPIINSPYEEPKRHFRFSDDGITDEIVEGRRASSYFVPIPRPRKRGGQLSLGLDGWTQDRVKENQFINDVRSLVARWRSLGYPYVTATTRQLLEHWNNPQRERRLFFCQIEALETAIYLAEAAKKMGDNWTDNELRRFNADANPNLFRIAFKMATGSGKTVVMAMLIAWQALNKVAHKQDARFSDTFLIVAPGITIRDRLRVLLPSDSSNYYRQRDIVPPELVPRLNQAKIVITNFHAFRLREHTPAGRLTKAILKTNGNNPFTETPGQMVRRVCRELENKRNIIVINDEAHHCYRRKPDEIDEGLKGEEREEAKRNDEYARVWISGLEAVREKIGIRVIYDLSATPFFLRGSGYNEGTVFPWVVSDFSLIDAIESGVVKIPRVPVEDNSMKGELPTYRELWLRIRDQLPKKGRSKKDQGGAEPRPPEELESALLSLYGNYCKSHDQWAARNDPNAPPPVMIVVCNNTNVSKMVFDYVAGWEKTLADGSIVLVPGRLELFSNVVDGPTHRIWSARPTTILIDSQELESGEAMSDDFKKIAAHQIEEFKLEYRERFPGRDIEKIAEEDLLREVLNTVGKPDKLGAQVKCVISVSMLSEGWDCGTVTHILGVRAFGTQLICEQVVGRGLRRMSYTPNEEGMFEPEYAEVYGVPFSFIPSAGSATNPRPGPALTRVRSLESRENLEITFPRLTGYRYHFGQEQLTAAFSQESVMTLTTEDVPTWTENAPIIGVSSRHDLEPLRTKRNQEVAFYIAKLVLEKYFRAESPEGIDVAKTHQFDPGVKVWLFPSLLRITQEWLGTPQTQKCVIYKHGTFPGLLTLIENGSNAADHIYRSIVHGTSDEKTILPILRPYDPIGSTRNVDFDTSKPVYLTTKSHISHVVADTDSWEQKLAQSLEEMPEVISYVKNQGLNFQIPYAFDGSQHNYVPDFIALVDDGHGPDDLLHLIVEGTGQHRSDKMVKVDTARRLWIPAVNNHRGFGRWDFIEVTDPWNVQNIIRDYIASRPLTLLEGN